MATVTAMRKRALELANSGQFYGWVSIESSMRGGHELRGNSSPLDDFDLRRELDARCSAAQREKAARAV
jgi:hypothetical protein